MPGVRSIKGPGELRPTPPDQPQDPYGLSDASPSQVVVEESDDLRHREDEHEIEKQLDERNALILG